MRQATNIWPDPHLERTPPAAQGVACSLAGVYGELLPTHLPPKLRALVDLLVERDAMAWKHAGTRRKPLRPTKLVLVVENDPTMRALTVTMLEETVLDVLSCESAEAAVALLNEHASDVAMLFTDIPLAGPMDGVDLATEVRRRWPDVRLVVAATDARERAAELPDATAAMGKPWRALDVLVQADLAVRQAGQNRSQDQ